MSVLDLGRENVQAFVARTEASWKQETAICPHSGVVKGALYDVSVMLFGATSLDTMMAILVHAVRSILRTEFAYALMWPSSGQVDTPLTSNVGLVDEDSEYYTHLLVERHAVHSDLSEAPHFVQLFDTCVLECPIAYEGMIVGISSVSFKDSDDFMFFYNIMHEITGLIGVALHHSRYYLEVEIDTGSGHSHQAEQSEAGRETVYSGIYHIGKSQSLTSRELDILSLIVDGRSTGNIASELFISRHTVTNHLTSIFSKFGVKSRRELVVGIYKRLAQM